ncbi:MAG: hypothetical protein MJ120_00215 [Clostridia bacterium]|nr:hypothetical protein [Clostridia bacterium]
MEKTPYIAEPIMLELENGASVKVNISFISLMKLSANKKTQYFKKLIFEVLDGTKKISFEIFPEILYAGYLCNIEDASNPDILFDDFKKNIPFSFEYLNDIVDKMLNYKKKVSTSSKPSSAKS